MSIDCTGFEVETLINMRAGSNEGEFEIAG
jgi:hypothetical protein